LASHHQNESVRNDAGAAQTGSWSPRNRLFFLIGATAAAWSIVALLIDAWT